MTTEAVTTTVTAVVLARGAVVEGAADTGDVARATGAVAADAGLTTGTAITMSTTTTAHANEAEVTPDLERTGGTPTRKTAPRNRRRRPAAVRANLATVTAAARETAHATAKPPRIRPYTAVA